MNINEKLLIIQSKLKAPKSQYNSFGKYAYRNAEDILEAVKPLLLETKTVLNISDDVVMVGDRYYIKARVTLSDTESTDLYSVQAFAREEENKKGMDGSQVTGAASSYARKYALNGLFAIDDTKDSDSTNQHGKGETVETRTKTQTKVPNKQKAQPFDVNKMVEVIKTTAKSLDMTDEELSDFIDAEYSVKTLEQLSREQGLALLETMKMYPKKEVS
ncbi:MAG: ERF superfamily protein [Microgenomates group bacterium ADurb.Bin238]|nr:MAG: ERF superfamily protein [Microgenomates group bacterium ADurb.Bin238]